MTKPRRIWQSDFPIIVSWWAGHNKSVGFGDFSDIGYMVDDIAACFLYLTNSNIAIIEGLVSNPALKLSVRKSNAIDAIIEACIKHAINLGYKNIYGFSRKDSVARRMQNKFDWSIETGWYFLSNK